MTKWNGLRRSPIRDRCAHCRKQMKYSGGGCAKCGRRLCYQCSRASLGKTFSQRPCEPRQRKPIPKRSKKMEKTYIERRKLVRWLLTKVTRCEARSGVCTGQPVDVHERLTRARGGSILDEANCMAVCRACHSYIHDNPKWATEQGFLISRYKIDAD